jgi:hypothetical protein
MCGVCAVRWLHLLFLSAAAKRTSRPAPATSNITAEIRQKQHQASPSNKYSNKQQMQQQATNAITSNKCN